MYAREQGISHNRLNEEKKPFSSKLNLIQMKNAYGVRAKLIQQAQFQCRHATHKAREKERSNIL